MAFSAGDLTHEVLARSHHYHHTYHSSHGSSSGTIQWWGWLILLVGAGALIWGLVKKFTG
ncbi:hypothetical protein [Streptomyces sp. NPDC059080]|uniref:hypothetical protein n=1 Tax=Streptomyces sp. NPDC059080 TaxID=3346718 RepID=UPI003699A665